MKLKSSNLVLLVEIAAIVFLHIAKYSGKEHNDIVKSQNKALEIKNVESKAGLIVWARTK